MGLTPEHRRTAVDGGCVVPDHCRFSGRTGLSGMFPMTLHSIYEGRCRPTNAPSAYIALFYCSGSNNTQIPPSLLRYTYEQ